MNDDKKSFVQKIITSNKELMCSTLEISQDQKLSPLEKLGKVGANAKESINGVFGTVSNPAIPVSIEDVFDSRVARSLKRLGTPTSKTLNTISEQLTEISTRLKEIDAEITAVKKSNTRPKS
jgi:hypothetical protein